MNEKTTEEEWKKKRDFTKRKLETVRIDIEICKSIGVLLKAEDDYCDTLLYQVNSFLKYWTERSIASRIRFVEGAEDA